MRNKGEHKQMIDLPPLIVFSTRRLFVRKEEVDDASRPVVSLCQANTNKAKAMVLAKTV